MIKRALRKVRFYVWEKRRNQLNQKIRKELNDTVKSASIISMNCTGGILSHDLGLRFLSPTVNLFMRANDYIKFCENLEYYMKIDEMEECRDSEIIEDRTYPIAYLGDITLFLVHYTSIEEAQNKWNERKKRINWNNIVIINTDREGMNEELKDRFEKLPYKKVMFVNKEDKRHSSCVYLKGYEKENCVGIITDPQGWSGKRAIDQFDWVGFFSNKDREL